MGPADARRKVAHDEEPHEVVVHGRSRITNAARPRTFSSIWKTFPSLKGQTARSAPSENSCDLGETGVRGSGKAGRGRVAHGRHLRCA
jgi:hypothetical protein